ncbi:GIY-YIG nuclease family protein [Staphylococcus coagulans]|uniref:GIY-YIG nuclease family protein n=1 Tax=Staphylococcus coagulans TaxID=74706 RepID=UPI0015FA973A|nr:GIY-YIG nuclease family protein [Staphylococcus coagulans]MBA8760839.1 GIY-YIG nuclease family protein [Staphylococcus coagulans]MBA8762981.1 GIY-YIG nuclease family protein [Staphylococcus coagulans]MBA8769551.1 GIY-YIG nuclease family protein [Staphylococcus coagulans]
MDKHYIYIVQCKDTSLYTGYTNNLAARIAKHNEGKGAKYTKSRRPVQLRYYETFETKSAALKRECAIKKMTRQQKIQLIEE